uniref:Uncharacterized protein n=1 Tax=Nelumbo nucifera TaxID=4432 RepID=A0A822YXM0_NELNU|nr:TPA_asm: hypothetical protein HUJ06_007891 [Nelumbo nucifera]
MCLSAIKQTHVTMQNNAMTEAPVNRMEIREYVQGLIEESQNKAKPALKQIRVTMQNNAMTEAPVSRMEIRKYVQGLIEESLNKAKPALTLQNPYSNHILYKSYCYVPPQQ